MLCPDQLHMSHSKRCYVLSHLIKQGVNMNIQLHLIKQGVNMNIQLQHQLHMSQHIYSAKDAMS